MSRPLSVFVAIGANLLPSLGNAASAVERRFGLMNRRIHAETKASVAGMQKSWGTFATHVSAPAGILAGMGARAVYEWSKVGNSIEAVGELSAKARQEIEGVARAMPGNPADNLSAALDLARTGFDAKAIQATLPVTVKLARSDPDSVNQAEAADILTNVMKAMGMGEGSVEQISRDATAVANALAFGAAKSSSDVRLMGESFKYAAPLASRLGVPLADLTGYFMTMADNGIKGSEAGVAFRSGMVRLLKPTKGAMGILAKYNMTLDDYVTASRKASASDITAALSASGIAAEGARGKIQALLSDPNLTGAGLVQRISQAVADGMGGGAEAADLDKISDAVTMALTAGVDKLDFGKFIKDVEAKGWKSADFVNFFDTRQGARLMTLFGDKGMVANIERVKAAMRVKAGQGTFLDQMVATQNKGAVGAYLRMQQSFGNVFIAMAQSGVMDAIATGMDRISSSVMMLSKANPGVLKAITYGLLGLAVLAPIGFALSGIGAGFSMLFSVLSFGTGIFLRFGGVLIGMLPRLGNLFLAFFRTGLGRGLVGALMRLGPLIVRGLALAFALLATPAGWAVILAGVAAALIYYFRDDIAKWWSGTFMPAWTGFWNQARADVMNHDWSGLGLLIGDALTGGLFSKIKNADWGGAIRSALGGPIMKLLPGGAVLGMAGDAIAAKMGPPAKNGGGGWGAPRKLAGQRAFGGPVRAGQTYLVGERGREFFTPATDGRIIPNHRTGAALASLTAGAVALASPAVAAPSVSRAAAPSSDRQVIVQPGAIVINGASDAGAVAREVARQLRRLSDGNDRNMSD